MVTVLRRDSYLPIGSWPIGHDFFTSYGGMYVLAILVNLVSV